MKKPIIVLILSLFQSNEIFSAIITYDKEVFITNESYPSISIYPVGYKFKDEEFNLSTRLALSNSLEFNIGIQNEPIYSCLGVYLGPKYDFEKEKIGFSTSVNVTALIFHLTAGYEYLEENKIKFGIGIGLPYIWFIIKK
jgi:hypothetical protein